MTLQWVDRLNLWLADKGWSVAEYARRVNADGGPSVSESSIRKYLEGKVAQPRGDAMKRLAAPFGKTALQLQTGFDNLSIGRSQIPLLSANEVGTLDPANSVRAWEGRSVSVLTSDVGMNWFGVEIPDDACAPKIVKGSIVYCDLDGQVSPGDYVIAKVPGEVVGVCRRYRKPDTSNPQRFVLVPENGDFPRYESSEDSPIDVWKVVKVLSDP